MQLAILISAWKYLKVKVLYIRIWRCICCDKKAVCMCIVAPCSCLCLMVVDMINYPLNPSIFGNIHMRLATHDEQCTMYKHKQLVLYRTNVQTQVSNMQPI